MGDGIKIDLREITWGRGDVEWIHLAQDRDRWDVLVNGVMNLRFIWRHGLTVTHFSTEIVVHKVSFFYNTRNTQIRENLNGSVNKIYCFVTNRVGLAACSQHSLTHRILHNYTRNIPASAKRRVAN
jgi:hypothetical protein